MRLARILATSTLALALVAAPLTAQAAPVTAQSTSETVTIMPGDAIVVAFIVTGQRCTATAPARDAHGTRYFLTAGHCAHGKFGQLVGSAVYYHDAIIGHVARASMQFDDYALIALNPNVVIGRNDVPHQADLQQPEVGTRVCTHRAINGIVCGRVLKNNVIVHMDGVFTAGFTAGTHTTIPSAPGNSGSAIYTSQGVVGLLSGGDDSSSVYVPIASVYEDLGDALPGFHIGD